MKATLLNGSAAGDPTGERAATALQSILAAQGWETNAIALREQKIGNCAGDFFCWVRTPGQCNIDDDNRAIAAAVINSDLLVYLTPVTFGGYSSLLKKAADHQIQNIAPFFTRLNGETHHTRRYPQYPDFLVIGWQEQPDGCSAEIFHHLAWRNTLNFYARRSACGVLLASQSDAEIAAAMQGWLNGLQSGSRLEARPLPALDLRLQPRAIHRAVLLVGSPRTRKSTSNALGSYLLQQLDAENIQTETIHLYTTLRSPERMQALFAAVDAADLVVLAFPLYVDSLPGPVIEALERIAERRRGQVTSQRFAALINCGFPEAQHNANARAVCAAFARQAGFDWAGSLALGGGEGLVHGAALETMDGRAQPLRSALALAAHSLTQGQPIPPAAQRPLDRPFIPSWLYRLVGDIGWRVQARRRGVANQLKRQTYSNR